MNTDVEKYFVDGCGRCPFYETPQCKVRQWSRELAELRRIVLNSGLTEESKWGVPCYTYHQKNVVTVSAFKAYSCISFFKGSLLEDKEGLLVKPGENSQAGRLLKFTNVQDMLAKERTIRSYVFEAIELEKAGIEVKFTKNPEPIPDEFEAAMRNSQELKEAFEALTPGRQRGYILHFSQPKQSKTRVSRIEKCVQKILDGKGFHDR
ncbi:MAG: YdeI/OmpD-associated family protein [Marinoscillum sp.]